MKKWVNYFTEIILSAGAVALGLWFFHLSRRSFIAFMGIVYVRGDHYRSVQIRVLEKFFFIFIGLLFIAFAIAVFEFTRMNLGKNPRPGKPTLLTRLALAVGVELLLIFLADLVLLWAQHFSAPVLRWVALAGELVLGVALTIYSLKIHRKLSAPVLSAPPMQSGPW